MSRTASVRSVRPLSTAVAAGSIPRCLTAPLPDDIGHDVTVLERSPSDLVRRGGGVVTSGDVVARTKRDGLPPTRRSGSGGRPYKRRTGSPSSAIRPCRPGR